jgi:CHASE2 domain-containing sensor protein/class 3 adenylate cyclase
MTPKSSSLISTFSQFFDAFWKKTITSKKLDCVITSIVTIALLLGMRQFGWLQPLEVAAFDFMVRLRPDEGPDPRLLVVEITEQDIQQLKQYPISDQVLAKVLGKLEQYQPIAIGVDLARNVPIEPGHAELIAQLRSPKLIAIANIGNTDAEAVRPPPGVSKERVGFSDVVIDPGGAVRRNFMLAPIDEKTTLYSFSLRLALAYLKQKSTLPQFTKTGELQLGKTVIQWLTFNSGGYQNIDDGGYQILLNYRSARNVARQVTLTQVLKGQIDPNWVKDKIVLIGTTAPTAKDLFYTPYSRTERGIPSMAGVLIHAQMVSQILSAVLDNRPLFWYWPEGLEVLWIVAWSSLGGVLVARNPNLLMTGLGCLACLCVLFGLTLALFMQGGWIPLAAPALGLIATGTAVEAYQRQLLQRQEQMVMKLLGQQTSPEIAKALWNERDRLLSSGLFPGQTLTATMLLSDLKGFSTISEQMSPEEVMAWLNEYLPVMVREVQNHHGIINKFTGDGLLAVFGVPIRATNDAEIGEDARRAVACALAMGDRLQELNQNWQSRGLPVVQMRVGIFTGPVMVGSLGGKERLEYGVIGDSVNIAARLESCEKHSQPSDCRILIAHETLVYLQEEFQVEAWGALQLKGKQHKVDVYRVINRKA